MTITHVRNHDDLRWMQIWRINDGGEIGYCRSWCDPTAPVIGDSMRVLIGYALPGLPGLFPWVTS